MKAYPKHIDWSKVIATNEIIDGDEEEEAKVAKASKDMKLSIMKEKFLAMIKSEKAKVKDYTKLVVTDRMVDYVLEKYDKGKGKLVEDNGKGKEVEHHHLKVNKNVNEKGKVHDIQNRVGSVEVDFAKTIKAKQAKKVKESKKARETKKAREAELAKKAMEAELR
uniref:Uncharacterized protein n=1 Tax=Tanacetum cinerariifolium TaxID=118510 RepID=A0A6L2L3L1_TANCI|nr:hypothetical protein [Tanacetum cinerariifolium]